MRAEKADNLLKDVRAAEASGFGVHYGNYKAAQKEKQEAMEREIRGERATENPESVCLNCGGKLPNGRELFCCTACSVEYARRRNDV